LPSGSSSASSDHSYGGLRHDLPQETRLGVLDGRMTILLSAVGVTLGAISIWLVVRIVNRRKKVDLEFRITLGFALLVLILVITPAICIFIGLQLVMFWVFPVF
jgi:uncharacterized Tic20 family protein